MCVVRNERSEIFVCQSICGSVGVTNIDRNITIRIWTRDVNAFHFAIVKKASETGLYGTIGDQYIIQYIICKQRAIQLVPLST